MSSEILRSNQVDFDKIKLQKREWYCRNRKSVLKQQKTSEKNREYQKDLYLKNSDQKIQKSLKWTEENPEQRRLHFKNMFRIILEKLNSANITTSPTIRNWNGLRILDGWKHSIHQKENYQNDLLLKLQTSKSLTYNHQTLLPKPIQNYESVVILDLY